jgi:hypothetical protein
VPEVEAATNALWWIHWAKIIGAFLVAIGVAAEFLGDFVAKPYEDTVEAARKAELAGLHTEAETAKSETARLSAEAEAAKGEIATAQAETAKANARAAGLEAIAAWRHLTKDQHDHIVRAMDGRNLQIDIQYIGDPEANNFAADFAKAFRDAGNRAVNSGTLFVNPPVVGLYVVSGPGSDALAAALEAAGIPFKPMNVTPAPPNPGLWVGGRQQPSFDTVP